MSSSTLLGLKPNLNQTAGSTATMTPPQHTPLSRFGCSYNDTTAARSPRVRGHTSSTQRPLLLSNSEEVTRHKAETAPLLPLVRLGSRPSATGGQQEALRTPHPTPRQVGTAPLPDKAVLPPFPTGRKGSPPR